VQQPDLTSQVTVATAADRTRVVDSLIAAFAGDPVLRHLFPDDASYPRYAGVFFGLLFDRRVPHGTVLTIGGGDAVAMWQRPDAVDTPDDTEVLATLLPADALEPYARRCRRPRSGTWGCLAPARNAPARVGAGR
jgi:hypothetical protein